METHNDRDFDFCRRLKERARVAKLAGAGKITAGEPDEPALAQWDHGGITVVQRPDDEQAILRISVGGGQRHPQDKVQYCVFRGNRTACAYLLEQAVRALRYGSGAGGARASKNSQVASEKLRTHNSPL